MGLFGSKRKEENWEVKAERELLEELQPLVTLCATTAEYSASVYRSELAKEGLPLRHTPTELFFIDVSLVVFNFARANGAISKGMGDIMILVGSAELKGRPINEGMHKLKQALTGDERYSYWRLYSEEKAELIEASSEVTVPLCVEHLATFDAQNGTNHAVKAAQIFLSLATLVSTKGEPMNRQSIAHVMDEYTNILTPYFEEQNAPRSPIDQLAGCTECAAAYQMLGLDVGAGREEIQAAYKDFAKIYHPDRFPQSDDRLRDRAEANFKRLQQAHNHIIEHLQP